MSCECNNPDHSTKLVKLNGHPVGALVYSDFFSGWTFIPHLPGRRRSYKHYPKWVDAVPGWCRKGEVVDKLTGALVQ